ncbi:hypothetical protein HW35_14430 [Bacillus sp. X1(2014)]|nr:hypothetical protein HW35_14430 [Bacillus sp. X1(2014)]
MSRRKKRSKQPSQVPPLDERHYYAIELMVRPVYDKITGGKRWLTRQEIANKVGVSRMQLWRWEQRKDFQREKEKRLKAAWTSKRKTRRSAYDKYVDKAIAGDAKSLQKVLELFEI